MVHSNSGASHRSAMSDEIASQPSTWRRAAAEATGLSGLPRPGERVAVIGCGTSWFMAQSWAALRERSGHGVTDAFTATEVPSRTYDRVIAISRSGTTTEIVRLLESTSTPSTLLTAVSDGPAAQHADHEVVLDWADERSVVQTRFATTALALLRAAIGEDCTPMIADAERALKEDIPASWVEADQMTFLGTGWTIGLAHEAALKLREASQSWTESYPAMEYRHGPISIAQPGRLVWVFGDVPPGLAEQVGQTGAEMVTSGLDPLAHLVLLQRLAVERAAARGLDPDRPRWLTRAVILDGED